MGNTKGNISDYEICQQYTVITRVARVIVNLERKYTYFLYILLVTRVTRSVWCSYTWKSIYWNYLPWWYPFEEALNEDSCLF